MSLIQKKRRVSKKSKLSWRKHVDITDVENFLEEKRLEERLGKPVSEKTDDELFLIDALPTPKPKNVITSKQKRRKLLRESIPKCFSILTSYTEVADPLGKRNHVKTQHKSEPVLKKKIRKLEIKGSVIPSLRAIKTRRKKLISKEKIIDFARDAWDKNSKDEDQEWINDDTKKHTLHGRSQYRKSVPSNVLSKPSILPAIEPPHPGMSYNPNFKDHQELMKAVVEKEKKLMKEELHLERVTSGMFSKVTVNERDTNWLVEMSQGLTKIEESDHSDGEYKSINPPVKNKKKDLKQRRRHREHLKTQHEQRLKKKQKRKLTDIQKINVIEQEINKESKKTDLIKSKRIKKIEYKKKEPKRLSTRKFEEEEIQFNAPENISGNLRNVVKEGDILVDRFKSFERRNILRPSSKHHHKKGKFKKFTRPGHKDDWKCTVARPSGTL
ncbi:hypothetical protein RN001_005892 [Aquatica leii]|uniref:Ribosome biogenesis protein NOP53 n=1 Tax=Aquatica leii TaxID=1421715 RepID=A0AAN7QKM4_9COLE|nr:hypothetical protein RN001_005892 [Aquatica leii]